MYVKNLYQKISNSIKKNFLQINNGLILVSKGSTAKLYSQIMNDAPIDFFLSADQKTILKIPQNKKIEKSQFTYAIGNIVLFSKRRINNLNDILTKNKNKKMVIFEIPLLIESKLMKNYDKIIFVNARKNLRKRRFAKKKKNIRIFNYLDKRQLSPVKKIKFCDYVINNNSSLNILKKNVKILKRKI